MAFNPKCSKKYTKIKGNSLESTKNFLLANEIISKIGDILSLADFRNASVWLKEEANKKGFFPDLLIYDIQGGKKIAYNIPAFKKLDGINAQADKIARRTGEQTSLFQQQSSEGIIASEKTIRDLAARMSDRIGIPYRIISDRTQEFKGKIENNTAIINLAYSTLDTPIHEILGHPIIRAIKNKGLQKPKIINDVDTFFTLDGSEYVFEKNTNEYFKDGEEISKQEFDNAVKKVEQLNNQSSQLYQNLLKELEYGRGKEVLDRIKKDYIYKTDTGYTISKTQKIASTGRSASFRINDKPFVVSDLRQSPVKHIYFDSYEDALAFTKSKYSLEEQQEEAIVELLGLMTAEKLDNVRDGKLISLLKRLLKEMKQFIRSLINQKEVEIDKLPDNMTLGDIADLLAYSNSKLILPGYEVEYTTPDNEKFKTYQEASNHISKLAKSAEDVDLNNIELENILPNSFTIDNYYVSKQGNNYIVQDEEQNIIEVIDINKAKELYKQSYEYQSDITKIESGILSTNTINSFIEKNKEYEQSKEIIEEWKKVNNIQYNPEEIYSRGQEFSSVVGAYSSFDVNLMMQNLLSHIEDNEKAGGKFAISAYTKPADKQIGHLEGGGGKIKFKIYPQSQDILWAANTDVYSGSVWDASEKVNKDKKSELLGVSYTKYPSLQNVNAVQPNLASIVDELSHHHNELAISLNFNNFEIEVDEDVPYQTKKIIENINKILEQKRLEEINNFINKLEKEC